MEYRIQCICANVLRMNLLGKWNNNQIDYMKTEIVLFIFTKVVSLFVRLFFFIFAEKAIPIWFLFCFFIIITISYNVRSNRIFEVRIKKINERKKDESIGSKHALNLLALWYCEHHAQVKQKWAGEREIETREINSFSESRIKMNNASMSCSLLPSISNRL